MVSNKKPGIKAKSQIWSTESALQKIAPAIDYIFAEGNPCGIKAVFKKLGVCGDTVRLPLVNISDSLQSKIDKFVDDFN